MTLHPHLRLVTSNSEEYSDRQLIGALEAEVSAVEAWHGRNSYTEFVRKKRRRPLPKEAEAIGRLINARVKASDGRLYPKQTVLDRHEEKITRKQLASEIQTLKRIQKLKNALSALASDKCDPAELVNSLCPDLDEAEIRLNLPDAVKYLDRFAQEWLRREKSRTD